MVTGIDDVKDIGSKWVDSQITEMLREWVLRLIEEGKLKSSDPELAEYLGLNQEIK